jgi:hypothetical protein
MPGPIEGAIVAPSWPPTGAKDPRPDSRLHSRQIEPLTAARSESSRGRAAPEQSAASRPAPAPRPATPVTTATSSSNASRSASRVQHLRIARSARRLHAADHGRGGVGIPQPCDPGVRHEYRQAVGTSGHVARNRWPSIRARRTPGSRHTSSPVSRGPRSDHRREGRGCERCLDLDAGGVEGSGRKRIRSMPQSVVG